MTPRCPFCKAFVAKRREVDCGRCHAHVSDSRYPGPATVDWTRSRWLAFPLTGNSLAPTRIAYRTRRSWYA